MQLNSYAPLSAFRDRLGLAVSDTGDDARLLAKLRAASAEIKRFTGRSFMPRIATRQFDWRRARSLFFRGYDLLELTSLINGDGSTIASSAITTLGGINGPIVGIELDVTQALFVYQTSPLRAITVNGVWGWHDDYASAWKVSNDVIPAGGVNSSATTFTVGSVNGADSWNLTPRFSPGQLIKVDTEYMQVVGADSGTNTLTVVRGANGSTVAAHTAGTAISVYVPPADIQEITLRWATWLYKMEDAGDLGAAHSGDAGIAAGIAVPPAIPADLVAVLVGLRSQGGVL